METVKRASLVVQTLPISRLEAHPRNPRRHPEPGSPEWETLKASLEDEYFDQIVWNKRNGMLVSGHLRTKVLRSCGFTEADCVVVDMDEPTHLARMVAANRLTGEDDAALLKDILQEIETGAIDMSLTGWTESEMERLILQVHQDEPIDHSEVARERETESEAREKRLEDNPKLREWIEKRKASMKRGKDAAEVNFWLCLVFQSRDQKLEFLAKYPGLSEETVYGMYVDGQAFAARVGQYVTPNDQKPIRVALDKTLSDMVVL